MGERHKSFASCGALQGISGAVDGKDAAALDRDAAASRVKYRFIRNAINVRENGEKTLSLPQFQRAKKPPGTHALGRSGANEQKLQITFS
jgi:hypothetical protein